MKLKPFDEFKHQQIHVPDDGTVKIAPLILSPTNYFLCYNTLKGCNLYSANIILSTEKLNEMFIPLSDFNQLDYNSSKNEAVAYTQAYKRKGLDYYITVDVELYDGDSSEFLKNSFVVSTLYYDSTNEYELSKIVEDLNILSSNKNNSSKISIVLKTMGGYVFKQKQIKPLDVNIASMYNDDFVPVYEHVVDSLTNGHKGIILFHGKAGTGKTNLIKYLTTQIPNKNFVFIPVSMIPSLTDPSFLGNLIDNKNSVLVLEDCENYLKDRGQTENSVVSAILNLSDGILSDILGIQIIATFNADLTKVDEALLRKGRLIDEYDFKELSVDKCQALMNDMKIDQIITEPMTLSEVFNIKDQSSRVQLNKRKKIGFGV